MLASFQKEPKPIDILDIDMVNKQAYLLTEYEDGTKQWVDSGFIYRWYRVLLILILEDLISLDI